MSTMNFLENLPIANPSAEFDRVAEQVLLGSILVDPRKLASLLTVINAEYFFTESHQLIFKAMCELEEEGKDIDEMVVGSKLTEQNLLTKIGGYNYLRFLAEETPQQLNLGEYVQIVRNLYFYRRLYKTARSIAQKSLNKSDSIERMLVELESDVQDIRSLKQDSQLVPITDVLSDMFADLAKRIQNPSDLLGAETGFIELDQTLLGLQGSDLIILAARPSMGKTALALNIAAHLSLHQRKRVYFFSLEMSKKQLAIRLVSSLCEVDAKKIKTGRLEPAVVEKIYRWLDKIAHAPLYICDEAGLNLSQLMALATKNWLHEKPDLIVIDYLQLVNANRRYPNREQEIAEISRGLKALAKKLDVPVLALSQLNRSPDSRANKRPLMSDIRESGSVEQDADVIMFLYRDEVYNENSPDKGIAEVIISKHRNGEVGVRKLAFLGSYTKFANLSFDTQEYKAYDLLNE